MTRTFMMTVDQPQKAFGLCLSWRQRIAEIGKKGWMGLVIAFTVVAVGVYVYQVNTSATKSFAVRDLERKVEQLQNSVVSLETQIVSLQSMKELQARVKSLNYVPVDRIEFVDAARGSYALAK